MLASPLHLDIRAGAVADLPRLLQDRYISTTGSVLVAVGPSTGEEIWKRIEPLAARRHGAVGVESASLAAAAELQAALGERGYDAVVAIGGGRTLDVAKYAATRAAMPMVAVATNLAHDGVCSPVASLEHPHGKGSFGVAMPLAVVVDLDYVRGAPALLVAAGIGDVVSNLSAIEDWLLAARERGEPVDGLALAFARTAAEAVIHRTGLHPRRRVPGRAGRGPGAVGDGDVGGRAPPDPAAGPATRSSMPSTSSSPGRPTTASSPGSGPPSPPTCAATRSGSRRSSRA